LLSSVEGQAAVLASLNTPEEDTSQASLSLEEAIEVVETATKEPADIPQDMPAKAEGPQHD
jgi:hypothetical protein